MCLIRTPIKLLKRGSDGATTNIAPLSAGGVANAAAQDSFCASTTCLSLPSSTSPAGNNHLTQAPPGGFRGPESDGFDNLAAVNGAPVTLNGQKVYSVFISPGTGYRNDATNGIATGDTAQGIGCVMCSATDSYIHAIATILRPEWPDQYIGSKWMDITIEDIGNTHRFDPQNWAAN
ncbi:alpha-L-arabinofuranosidase B, catalytic-domain-containing protein [Mycena epipterygia]|nr:alpha-L-arabinofuranosidase B, catalytic-domain-containing protein [Mycena epipterygia]